MIEKWKLALREFLKKYEEDDDVIGAILCVSYALDCYNESSDIDVYLVLKDGCTYKKRGMADSNSYLIDYFMSNKDGILASMEDEFNNNKNSTSMMFAYGKIIYDLDDTVKYLQSKALEYVDSSFNEITSMKLDTNNYQLWNYLNKLKVMLKEDNPEFNLIYYSLLSDVYDMYSEFLGLSKLPKSKVYKILSSEDYRRKLHIFKLPEEEFIKLYLNCFELDKPSIMYNNMEKLINYYYKKQGGFNIRTFEITTQ